MHLLWADSTRGCLAARPLSPEPSLQVLLLPKKGTSVCPDSRDSFLPRVTVVNKENAYAE